RRRHTRFSRDWSSDVCSSDLPGGAQGESAPRQGLARLANGWIWPAVLGALAGAARLPGGALPLASGYVVALLTAGDRRRAAVARSEERRVGKGGRSRRPTDGG